MAPPRRGNRGKKRNRQLVQIGFGDTPPFGGNVFHDREPAENERLGGRQIKQRLRQLNGRRFRQGRALKQVRWVAPLSRIAPEMMRDHRTAMDMQYAVCVQWRLALE
jgi:hypothetical protein